MSKIVCIADLYDYYSECVFGYAGMDLSTGVVRYFFEEHHDYKPTLIEFDRNNITHEMIAYHMEHCLYKRPKFAKNLPSELEQIVATTIDEHRVYNQANDYPTKYLDFNRANLSVERMNNFTLFGPTGDLAAYQHVANKISVVADKDDWQGKSKENLIRQRQTIDCLRHEVGHMKVSHYYLDEAKSKLIVQTGFYTAEKNLEPIQIANGDIFYMVARDVRDTESKLMMRAIEEIINELDCQKIWQNYHRVYPELGAKLDFLCDYGLRMARYSGNIAIIYESLLKIINDISMAKDLLSSITNSLYGDHRQESMNDARKLLRVYKSKKLAK